MKIKALIEILRSQCLRFKVDPKFLDLKGIAPTSLGITKVDIKIKDGIPRETSLEIVKLIKGLKVKVQPTILDDHIRISGNKIDDLQEIMRLLMEQDYDLTLQFVNIKR
jgi:uncharacterized protein YajQ (UPF0234 family)